MEQKKNNIAPYETIYDFQNLYRAHQQTRKGKSAKKEVIVFEQDLGYQLKKLQKELREKTYHPGGYRLFYVYEPKMREVQALPYRDRVVQRCLCDNILVPFFERRLIYDNGACRKGKGVHFAQDRFTGFLRRYYREWRKRHPDPNEEVQGYFLKIDVRKYFLSIDHEVLKKKLRKVIDEEEVLEFMVMLIDSYHGDTGVGIPLGNQSSQLMASFYLDSLDRLIKEKFRIKYYVRIMDDMVMIHEDREFLQNCLNEIKQYTREELKLQLNEKTQITPVRQGVDFIGFHFYLTNTGKVIKKLRTSSKKRIYRNLKGIKKRYEAGELELSEVTDRINSMRAHMLHGDTWHLRKRIFSQFVLNTPKIDINTPTGKRRQ